MALLRKGGPVLLQLPESGSRLLSLGRQSGQYLHLQRHARLVHVSCSLQGWRNMQMFDNIWKLVGVPVITVQLRYDGWVTEMQVCAWGLAQLLASGGIIAQV